MLVVVSGPNPSVRARARARARPGLGLEQVGDAVLAAHAAQPLTGVGLACGEQRSQLAGAELGRRASCARRRCSGHDVAVVELVAAGSKVGPDGGVAAVDGRPLRQAARHHARLAARGSAQRGAQPGGRSALLPRRCTGGRARKLRCRRSGHAARFAGLLDCARPRLNALDEIVDRNAILLQHGASIEATLHQHLLQGVKTAGRLALRFWQHARVHSTC